MITMKENTKRIFAMAAAIMMTVTMFASCGSASDGTYKAENDTNITNNDVKGEKALKISRRMLKPTAANSIFIPKKPFLR